MILFKFMKMTKNTYFNKNKHHDYKVKYFGTDETIRHLFENDDEECNIYKINQQHQSFSGKILLPLDEYLEKIRPKLTELITKIMRLNSMLILFLHLKQTLMMSLMCLLKMKTQWNCIQLILMKYLVS